MGTKKAGTKQTTAPKGKPTPRRDPRPSNRGRYRSTIQWGLVALAILTVIVLAVLFGPDWSDRLFRDNNPGPATVIDVLPGLVRASLVPLAAA